MTKWYKLEGQTPVECDILEANRRDDNFIIKQESIGDAFISTVFLPLDHSFGDGPPLLFETMIFGGKQDQYQARYSTTRRL